MIGVLLAFGAEFFARSHDGLTVCGYTDQLQIPFRRKSGLRSFHYRSMTLKRRAFLWASSICS